jgi:hypothetical protein
MDASDLDRGQTYYRLTFADPDFTMPGVDPLVYVGVVQSEEGGEAYCFQDTVSFVRFGFATECKGNEELPVYFVPATELGSIFSLKDIATEIQSARERAETLGYPRLRHLTGPWI